MIYFEEYSLDVVKYVAVIHTPILKTVLSPYQSMLKPIDFRPSLKCLACYSHVSQTLLSKMRGQHGGLKAASGLNLHSPTTRIVRFPTVA